MKRLLVYHNHDALGEQWRGFVGGHPDVAVLHADICRLKVDAIVSPANSFGFMDGSLDHVLSDRLGWALCGVAYNALPSRSLRS